MDVTSSIRCKALISSPGADVSTRESKEKCETQVLPPEIWRVIAGHLGPCEWARAAGVCKATHHLQLDPVYIKAEQCEGFPALLGEQRCKVAAQKITLFSEDGARFSSYKCQSAGHSEIYFATPKWLLQPNRTGH